MGTFTPIIKKQTTPSYGTFTPILSTVSKTEKVAQPATTAAPTVPYGTYSASNILKTAAAPKPQGPSIVQPVSLSTQGSTPQTSTVSTLDTVSGIAKSVLQASPRAAAGYALDVQQHLGGGPVPTNQQGNFQPVGIAQQAFFGSEPVKPLSGQIAQTELAIQQSPIAQKLGVSKYATPLAVGLSTLDLSPLGGGKKAPLSLLKEADIQALAKLNDVAQVADKLDALLPGLKSSPFSKALTENIAVTQDPAEIKKMIDFAVRNTPVKATPRYSYDKLPTPKKDEQVVAFVPTKDGADPRQYVNTVIEAQRNVEGTPIFGVVKKSELQPTGIPEKDAAGERLLARDVADRVIAQGQTIQLRDVIGRFTSEMIQKAKTEGESGFVKNPFAKQETNEQIAILEEAIADNPARSLMKYLGKGDNTLAEQNARYLGTSRKSADLDQIVTELGYKDLDEAQQALDDYIAQKARLEDLKQIHTQIKTAFDTPIPRRPKERGFVASAKEAIPEANKIAGQYVSRSTDNLAIKAKNLIEDSPQAAEHLALTGTDDKAVAVASELLKKLGDDARAATDPTTQAALYDKAAEIANTLAPKLTELGRSVQAASILGRLTPEGQVRFAAREIARHNELNPLKKIPELTGEQVQHITDEMHAINAMPDGIEKAQRFSELQKFVHDLVPTPLMKKIITVWKAGLLTGLKTSGLNIFSNLSHATLETAKDIPAAAVDSVASLLTGKRTVALTTKGAAGGLKEGFDRGVRYLKTGFDERNLGDKLDLHQVNFGKNKVAKVFQAYTDTVFRILGTEDQPFYYGALARSLRDQAIAQAKTQGLKDDALTAFAKYLVQNPTDEMMRYGLIDATTAVFQNKTTLGEVGKGIQKLGGGAGEIVLPFSRTPSAVAMQIINYSPVGAVKTIIQNWGAKFDQRLFSQGIGRALTGTAIIYIGWELSKKGMLALDRPTTEKEQKLWELEGRTANSIKINGKWRSPQVLGPAGNLILIGGHIHDSFQKVGSPSGAIATAALSSLNTFTQQTFLTGLDQLLSAIKDPVANGYTYAASLASSVVPTLASDVARATDTKERRAETIPQRIEARIPGARQTLEPQVDVLGQERPTVGNPLEVMADPTRPSPSQTTPVIAELRRLSDAGFKVSPSLLGDKEGYPALTQKQNTQLWENAGTITNQKLTSLFALPQYQKLDDEQKGKAVAHVVEQSQIVARAAIAIELTDGLQGDELKAKLAELKKGKLLTKQVFDRYLELR